MGRPLLLPNSPPTPDAFSLSLPLLLLLASQIPTSLSPVVAYRYLPFWSPVVSPGADPMACWHSPSCSSPHQESVMLWKHSSLNFRSYSFWVAITDSPQCCPGRGHEQPRRTRPDSSPQPKALYRLVLCTLLRDGCCLPSPHAPVPSRPTHKGQPSSPFAPWLSVFPSASLVVLS